MEVSIVVVKTVLEVMGPKLLCPVGHDCYILRFPVLHSSSRPNIQANRIRMYCVHCNFECLMGLLSTETPKITVNTVHSVPASSRPRGVQDTVKFEHCAFGSGVQSLAYHSHEEVLDQCERH